MTDKDIEKFERFIYVINGKRTNRFYPDSTGNVFEYYYEMTASNHYLSWRALKEEVRKDFLKTRERYRCFNNDLLVSKEQVRDLEQLFRMISEI